ncbi:MAG: phage tail sheath family protein, partial [Sedimentisphaerales bacterium]|nr:phage tail sheath family protein [Sedimentisphaerales bacterium]
MYIQEVESDVRTIVPVDTATTAFIGRALRGPVNKPIICNSYADFQRVFGGLWLESNLGYAVNQFFLNGGSKAVIVRLYHPQESSEEKTGATTSAESQNSTGVNAGKAKIDANGLALKAASPGAWGNHLCVRITSPGQYVEQIASRYGVTEKDLFNLTVHDTKTGATEHHADLTIVYGPRQVDKVLENESQLIAFDGTLKPDAKTKPPKPHPQPEGTKGVWEDEKAHSKAKSDSGSDGDDLGTEDLPGDEAQKSGIYALEHADIFNLLCIPPYKDGGVDVDTTVLTAAAAYCEKRRAMLLVDPPENWTGRDKAKQGFPIDGLSSNNAAIFFPRINVPNPLRDNQVEAFAPSGTIAGIFARTDATRGVWKAPAGLDATLKGVVGLTIPLTDAENGELNPLGINCLRQMPAAGYVVWGARTIVGDDRLASQWKYIPVRRTALYIEESLYRGTQWAVFEPNDEPLWSQLRLNISVFMHGLFRQGAFQGQ